MDPFSLITGILDVTERCIQGYNFLKDIKGAPLACLELIEQLETERVLLVELHEHVNRAEDKEKVQLSASLQSYKRALDKLDAVSKKYRDPKFKFNFVERAKWARSGEKKLKALHADLKQNSGNFQPLLLQIAKDIGEMNKRQREVEAEKAARELEMIKHQQETVAREAVEKLAKRLRKIEKWLEPLNSQTKLREVRERRQPETCDWLLSHDRFISWCESTGSFLWLNGIPGNGKTILASSVIDYLETKLKRAGENIVLFAFADFQDVRSTDVVVLLRTLLVQLLEHYKPEDFFKNPDFVELENAMERDRTDLPKSFQYLVELLEKASAPWKRVFVVIDALDECTRTRRRESITAIRKLAPAGSKFSILVTSREERDIVDVLNSVPTISLADETSRVRADIKRFIEDQINKSYHPLACLPEPVRTRISSTLLKNANGMFRLVNCQLQSLAKANYESDINKILENLPSDLNSMYERILQSIEEDGQRAVKTVQCTLWWLVGSCRQLRLEEVMEAVMVEESDSLNTDLKPLSGEHLVEMCSSLVRHNAWTDFLTLSHAFVQDFLFSNYLERTKYHCYHLRSFPSLYRHITGLIAAYLQYRDFQVGPYRTPQSLVECLKQHPFLVYVASNWHRHIIKMYEPCSESGAGPFDICTFFALSDDSEMRILAWRLYRQVSHFGTCLRSVTTGGSSGLHWNKMLIGFNYEDFLDITESEDESLQYVSGVMVPKYHTGPSWLPNDHPRIITPAQELEFMVCSLVCEGTESVVRDLLQKLLEFKNRPLFNCGTPLMISVSARKLDIVKMLL